MTDKKKRGNLAKILGGARAPFYLEMYKGVRGSVVSVSEIIRVIECEEFRVELLSRRGKMAVLGEGLSLLILEDKSAEIVGKILAIEMTYGRDKLNK